MNTTETLVRPQVNRLYYRFYKVRKNDTAVIAVSVNDLKPFAATYSIIKTACLLNSASRPAFSLPAGEFIYRGFLSKIKAMKYAKAGALKYLNNLIEEGEKSRDLLLKYRHDHYDDLNFNLTDRNIRNVELRNGC